MERLTAKLAPLKPDELIELLKSVDYDDVITGKQDQVSGSRSKGHRNRVSRSGSIGHRFKVKRLKN